MYTDASLAQRGGYEEIPGGIGAMLTQVHDGQEVVCAWLSSWLAPAHRNYPIPRLEALAFVWAVGKLNSFLDGQHFVWRTDAHTNQFLQDARHSNNQVLYCYSLVLQEYQFTTEWVPGMRIIADPLSRMLVTPASGPQDAMTLQQLVFGPDLGPRVQRLKDPHFSVEEKTATSLLLIIDDQARISSQDSFTLFATSEPSREPLDPDVSTVLPVSQDLATQFQAEDQLPVESPDLLPYSRRERHSFAGLHLVCRLLRGDPTLLAELESAGLWKPGDPVGWLKTDPPTDASRNNAVEIDLQQLAAQALQEMDLSQEGETQMDQRMDELQEEETDLKQPSAVRAPQQVGASSPTSRCGVFWSSFSSFL